MNLGWQPEPEPAEQAYVFVFLDTGPAEDLTDEQLKEAFNGHFANMNRLTDEGKLLLAGPFGESESGKAHRGLWIFRTPDVEKALEFGGTDPTVKAGIFVLDGRPLTTQAPIHELPRLNREDKQRRQADADQSNDGWQGRAYIIALAPMDDQLAEEVQDLEGVLVMGRLHNPDPEKPDDLILWLDAEDEQMAKEILPTNDQWSLYLWYGTNMVEQMRAE